ncbi:MAG: tryptophan synthase subunit alpha, partial [Candidatus Levyibacteriota bacterium]
MNLLDKKLQEIQQRSRIGLMTHLVVGYPTLADTVSLVKTMAASGVDMIELQIPFSDPLADGPTIMKACEASLANGTKVKDAFIIMSKLSK